LLTGRGDALSRHLLSDVFLAQGRFAESAALWQQSGEVEMLLETAAKAAQASQPEAALAAFEAAYALNAEDAALGLASFQLNSGKPAQAEELLRQALENYPASNQRAQWLLRLGDVLQTEKRWDEASAVYRQTLSEFPQTWQAHIGLGRALYQSGAGLAAARAEFDQAMRLADTGGNAQASLAQILLEEKRFAEAESWFSRAIALNPNVAWWYVLRASAARQAGDVETARQALLQGLEHFPNFGPLYFELSVVYRLQDLPDEAAQAIQRALELTQKPPAFYFVRAGAIYEWRGEKSQALQAYQQALSIDPKNEAAQSGAQRLGQ